MLLRHNVTLTPVYGHAKNHTEGLTNSLCTLATNLLKQQ